MITKSTYDLEIQGRIFNFAMKQAKAQQAMNYVNSLADSKTEAEANEILRKLLVYLLDDESADYILTNGYTFEISEAVVYISASAIGKRPADLKQSMETSSK